jgi:HEAT repeat protein
MASRSLDQLRTLLDHLDGAERSHQLAFFQGILEAGPAAMEELDGRLPGSRAPKALRRLALEASFYYPWPGWVPILHRLLRHEADHAIFETGVRALGRIGGPAALEALRDLHGMRQEPEFAETLAEVLSQTDPREAFNHYFGQLLEGSANTRAANEAAQRLVGLVDGTRIEALQTLIRHPDLLVFRSALMLLAHVFTPEAAQALRGIFLENHREMLADRRLKEAMAVFRTLPPVAAFETAGAALESLDLAADFGGLLGDFYQDVQAATQEGKASQLGSVLTQAVDAMHLRSRRLGFALDAAAEGLGEMAVRGLIGIPEVLDLLVPAYREQTGREGVARALARLVPAEAEAIHQLILGGPDGAQRAAAVEVLGARADPALQPALLQACRDPLTDIADRARFFIGQLPEAEDLALALLHAPGPADFQLGLRLVAERRFSSLVPDLLALLRDAAREELSLQLVEVLGAVGSVQVVEPLLELLHSGQSARLQTAIAVALRDAGQLRAAMGLCAKTVELKNPGLHTLAVEALAAAGGALPAEVGPVLLDQVRGAWNDRNPWPLRLRVALALQAIELPAPAVWAVLVPMVNDALQEKRSPSAWSPDELHQVQAAARDLSRRAF